jgi:hypothetical protein
MSSWFAEGGDPPLLRAEDPGLCGTDEGSRGRAATSTDALFAGDCKHEDAGGLFAAIDVPMARAA